MEEFRTQTRIALTVELDTAGRQAVQIDASGTSKMVIDSELLETNTKRERANRE